jgi:dCMP deaminase
MELLMDVNQEYVKMEIIGHYHMLVHAEMNMISKLAKGTESSEGCTVFITHSPCMDCAKLMYQSGISKVYYNKEYRDTSGIDFLREYGVEVIRIKTDN